MAQDTRGLVVWFGGILALGVVLLGIAPPACAPAVVDQLQDPNAVAAESSAAGEALAAELAEVRDKLQARQRELEDLRTDLDVNFREMLQHDIPELADPALDDWTRTTLLREWVAEHVDVELEKTLDYEAAGLYSDHPGEVMANFFADRGGVWCAGFAHALLRIYELFDIPCYYFAFGWPDAETHVTHAVTLVEIEHEGEQRIVVQDPYLNLTLADAAGAPLDIRDMLRLLKQGEHERIQVRQATVRETDVLWDPQPVPITDSWVFHGEDPNAVVPVEILADGRVRYETTLSFEKFEQGYFPLRGIAAHMQELGHPPRLIYLYLYPFALKHSNYTDDPGLLTELHTIAGTN